MRYFRLLMAAAVAVLAADTAVTLHHVDSIGEANPVYREMAEGHPAVFVAVRTAHVALIGGLLAALRREAAVYFLFGLIIGTGAAALAQWALALGGL